MKTTLIASAVSAAILSLNGAALQAATAQEATLEELSRYTEHRRDVTIADERFTFLKLNYGNTDTEEVVVDANGKLRDPREILKLNRARFEKYGRIHPHLYAAMESGNSDLFDVLMWIRVNTEPIPRVLRPTQVDKGAEEKVEASLAAQYKKIASELAAERRAVLAKLGIEKWVEEGMENTPFVRVQLSRGEIEELSRNTLVRMLMLREDKGLDDLADAMAVANADDVHATGITGDGVKVAVFENAPNSTANLDIEDSYSASIGAVPATSTHAQHVTAIIKNLNVVSGFAPDARTYSADSKNLAAFDWAVDDIRVSVLNQSFHRNAEINDGLSSDDLYKDYKVLHYPWPTIVHAAGNWCGLGSSCYEMGSDVTDEFVNHKGFNTISVGNHNDDASAMSASSVFVNPTSARGDRELPELSANGTGVDADGMVKSGTSMASPAVVGSVALLQDAVSTLRYWPEANRALLFAGASNVTTHSGTLSGGGAAADAPGTWWDDVSDGNDGFDGAGALNAERSVEIAGNRWDGTPGNQGWDIGRMDGDDFGKYGYYERTYTLRPQTDGVPMGSPHVRVALAWNSTATVDGADAAEVYASELGMDLDIRVFDASGAPVAHSLSWENSYEIVDFDAKGGETYTVKVHRWSTKPSAWTWFGIAWDTVWPAHEIPQITATPIRSPFTVVGR
jgi:hypothetical protein